MKEQEKKPWEGVDLRKFDFIPAGWPKPDGNIHKVDFIPGYIQKKVEEVEVEEEPKKRGRPRKED